MAAALAVDRAQGTWRNAGHPRRFAFYGLAGVFTAVCGLDFVHHLLDFSQDGGVHHVHVAMHAVVTGSLLVGMAVQLRRPARNVAALQQAFVVSVVAAAVAALGGNIAVLPFAFIAVGVVVVLLHPSRTQMLQAGRVNLALLIAAVLAAPPVIGYALGQYHLQVIGADPIHASRGHYALMASGVVALLLVVVVAALGARGFRVPAWTAGIGSVVLGAFSIVGPADSSSFGTGWGIAAIAAGIVVVGLSEWHLRYSGTQIQSAEVAIDPRVAAAASQRAID
jgi:hypothetical protein